MKRENKLWDELIKYASTKAKLYGYKQVYEHIWEQEDYIPHRREGKPRIEVRTRCGKHRIDIYSPNKEGFVSFEYNPKTYEYKESQIFGDKGIEMFNKFKVELDEIIENLSESAYYFESTLDLLENSLLELDWTQEWIDDIINDIRIGKIEINVDDSIRNIRDSLLDNRRG